jgi:hypothetical protein
VPRYASAFGWISPNKLNFGILHPNKTSTECNTRQRKERERKKVESVSEQGLGVYV